MTPFDRLVNIMTKPWIIISYLGVIVISFLYFDEPIASYFMSLNLRVNLPILTWITKLGTGLVYILGFFLLALFFHYVRPNRKLELQSWFLWFCVVIPGLICVGLKMIFGRARPDLLFSNHFYGFYGFETHASFWSFPSGHTTTIMGLVYGLSVVLPRYGYAFMLAGLIIASSRIVLTHHYLSDVLVAAYLSMIEVAVMVYYLRKKAWLAPRCRHAI